MEPSIALASGAEDNELATWAAELIGSHVRGQARARRDFCAMRAAVVMVAPDRRLSATLRFDLGRLTIHDGMIGVPDVTLCADYEVLLGVAQVPLTRWGRLPLPGFGAAAPSRAAWRRIVVELVGGDLKIYGLVAHPRLVLRLLRVLAPAP